MSERRPEPSPTAAAVAFAWPGAARASVATFAAFALTAVVALASPGVSGPLAPAERVPDVAGRAWPEGTRQVAFENLEGVILIECTLHGYGGRDTTGPLVLDTGAGFLALDRTLALVLGLADSLSAAGEVAIAPRALPRLEFGGGQYDQVAPVLTVEGDVVRRVTDRPVLGLVGERLLANCAVRIDYRNRRLALVPVAGGAADASEVGGGGRDSDVARAAGSRAALRDVLSAAAVPVPFHLAGDGKLVIEARVSDPRPPRYSRWLSLIVDTGATKCVAFDWAIEQFAPRAREWRELRGLWAPTLFGAASARLVRVPELELRAVRGGERVRGLDLAVIRSELGDVLSRATGEAIHGLLGYSFLKHYRVTIDYPHRVMWLERERENWDERPWEYSHVGLQLERDERAARVVAVAEGSPAALAGIAAGDELVALDGGAASALDIVELSRRLEGRPGSITTLVIRRGTIERTYRLTRRQLL